MWDDLIASTRISSIGVQQLWSALDKNVSELSKQIEHLSKPMLTEEAKLQNAVDYQHKYDEGPCGCEESVSLRSEVAMQAAEMGRLRDELDSLRKANRRLMIRSGARPEGSNQKR